MGNLQNLLQLVMNAIWLIGGGVFVISVVIGGIMRMTAYGNERRIAMSNMALSAAVAGLVIMLLSLGIYNFITGALGGQAPLLPNPG